MMQPSCSDTADIHAGTLSDRLQSFEDGDVFRGVVRGWHVYNVRLLRELTRVPLVLCVTIVAAFEAGLAARVTISEDVAVPGGRAAVAAALGIDPVPERARFVAEIARLVYDVPAGRNAASDARLHRVKALATVGATANSESPAELVPIPLT